MELRRNSRIVVKSSINELLKSIGDYSRLVLTAPFINPLYEVSKEGLVKAKLLVNEETYEAFIKVTFSDEENKVLIDIKCNKFNMKAIIKLLPVNSETNIVIEVEAGGDISKELLMNLVKTLEAHIIRYISLILTSSSIEEIYRLVIKDYNLKILERPDLLENEVVLSKVILSSSLVDTLTIELPLRNFLKYVDGNVLPKLEGSFIYLNFRNDLIVRLLISPDSTLIGVRVDFSNGNSLSGLNALTYLLSSDKVVRGKLYVFKVRHGIYASLP